MTIPVDISFDEIHRNITHVLTTQETIECYSQCHSVGWLELSVEPLYGKTMRKNWLDWLLKKFDGTG